MACKYLVKYKHNFIQSYRYEKTSTEKIVAIKIKVFLFLIIEIMRDSSEKIENKNQSSIINEFMHKKSCYKSSTSKCEKSISNINISKISPLTFDMLWYLLEYMTTLCKMYQQLESTLKRPVAQNSANGTAK